MAEPIGELGRNLHGEAGLAHAADSGEGDDPMGVERLGDIGHVVDPAHELGQLYGEVAGQVVERTQRREVLTVDVDLPDPLGARQVTQPVFPEVDERERVVAQTGGDGRDDDLVAVGDAHQACGAIDPAAEVVAIAKLRLAGVRAHPHPQATGRAERRRAQVALDGDRGGRPRRGRWGRRRGCRRPWSSPCGRRASRLRRGGSHRVGPARPSSPRDALPRGGSIPRGR